MTEATEPLPRPGRQGCEAAPVAQRGQCADAKPVSRVDEAGNLVIPPGTLARAGIGAAVDGIIEVGAASVRVVADSLRKVYVEATSVCDLACVMCLQRTWDELPGHMPLNRYARLLDGLPDNGPRPITLTFAGFGEPLMHPDIIEMIRLARTRGLRVEIITNGTRLDTTITDALAALGVAQVTVSVDGGDEAAFESMGRGSLRRTLEGIAALRETRRRRKAPLTIGLACVATRRNDRSLPSLLRIAHDLDVDFISISNLVPHTAEMAEETLCERTAFLTNPAPAAWRPRIDLARIDRNDVTRPLLQAIEENAPVAPPPATDAGSWRNRCRFAHEGMLAVTSDGRVAPCLSLMRSHTEFVNGQAKTVTGMVVGHVDETPLQQIWRTPAFREFRQRVRSFEFPPCFGCGPCPMTVTNQEDCYGDPAPVCSECLWAQNIVLCP
jgi:MoaA/NifB/PqqE/SkfB family radical SAM enzyme